MARFVIEKVKPGDQLPPDVVGLRKTISLPDVPTSVTNSRTTANWLWENPGDAALIHVALLELLETFPPHTKAP